MAAIVSLAGCSKPKPIPARPALPVGWIDYAPAGYGFAVYLPKSPTTFPMPQNSALKESKMWGTPDPPLSFLVGFIRVATEASGSDRERLLKFSNSTAKGFAKPGVSIGAISDVDVRGLPGRRTEFEIQDGRSVVAYYTIKGDRYYSVMVIGPPDQMRQGKAKAFLDSFEIR
jgi:hypothetical protein